MIDVAKLCAPLLAELGFRKRARGIFTIDLEPEVLGWLGLNRATQHRPAGEVEINPIVGVRHQAVERIIAACRGETFHTYQPPSVSTPIGYLMPEARYRAWVFADDVAAGAVARDMAAAIESWAKPFMRSTSSLPELSRRIEEGMGVEDQLNYRHPVVLYLTGEIVAARTVLHETRRKVANRTDLAAQELRRFAEALDAEMGVQC
jgi:hypothetical protein